MTAPTDEDRALRDAQTSTRARGMVAALQAMDAEAHSAARAARAALRLYVVDAIKIDRLTVSEVARELRMSRTTIQDWIRGERS